MNPAFKWVKKRSVVLAVLGMLCGLLFAVMLLGLRRFPSSEGVPEEVEVVGGWRVQEDKACGAGKCAVVAGENGAAIAADEKATATGDAHLWYSEKDGRCRFRGVSPYLREYPAATLTAEVQSRPRGKFSAHWCISESDADPRWRSCQFRNICYDRWAGLWTLHLSHTRLDDSGTEYVSTVPVVDSADPSAGPLFSFPNPFLSFRIQHQRELDQGKPLNASDTTMSLRILPGPIPKGSSYHWLPDESYFLLEPHVPDNIGHFFFETLLALFELGSLFRDTNNPLHGAHVLLANVDISKENVEHRFLSQLLDPLTSRTYAQWNRVLKEAPKEAQYLCMRSLVAGAGRFELDARRAYRSVMIQRLVEALRRHYDIVPVAEPRPCQITVYKKRGRRRPEYEPGLAQRLKAEFPGCRVELLDPMDIPLVDELQLLAKTTVLVSPCGGMSIMALFLPRHSVHLSLCTYSIFTKYPVSIEHYMWRHIPHLITMFYPLDPDSELGPNFVDVELSGPDPQPDSLFGHLRRCEFDDRLWPAILTSFRLHVNTDRLVSFLHLALEKHADFLQ